MEFRTLILGDDNFTFTPCFLESKHKQPDEIVEVASCLPEDKIPDEYRPNYLMLKAQKIATHFAVNPAQLRNHFFHNQYNRVVFVFPGLAFTGFPTFVDKKQDPLFKLRLHMYAFGFIKSSKNALKPQALVQFVWPRQSESGDLPPDVPWHGINLNKIGPFCEFTRSSTEDEELDAEVFADWRPLVHNESLPDCPHYARTSTFVTWRVPPEPGEAPVVQVAGAPGRSLSGNLEDTLKQEGDAPGRAPDGGGAGNDWAKGGGQAGGQGAGNDGDGNLLFVPMELWNYTVEVLPHVNDLFKFEMKTNTGELLLVSKPTLKFDPRFRSDGAPAKNPLLAGGRGGRGTGIFRGRGSRGGAHMMRGGMAGGLRPPPPPPPPDAFPSGVAEDPFRMSDPFGPSYDARPPRHMYDKFVPPPSNLIYELDAEAAINMEGLGNSAARMMGGGPGDVVPGMAAEDYGRAPLGVGSLPSYFDRKARREEYLRRAGVMNAPGGGGFYGGGDELLMEEGGMVGPYGQILYNRVGMVDVMSPAMARGMGGAPVGGLEFVNTRVDSDGISRVADLEFHSPDIRPTGNYEAEEIAGTGGGLVEPAYYVEAADGRLIPLSPNAGPGAYGGVDAYADGRGAPPMKLLEPQSDFDSPAVDGRGQPLYADSERKAWREETGPPPGEVYMGRQGSPTRNNGGYQEHLPADSHEGGMGMKRGAPPPGRRGMLDEERRSPSWRSDHRRSADSRPQSRVGGREPRSRSGPFSGPGPDWPPESSESRGPVNLTCNPATQLSHSRLRSPRRSSPKLRGPLRVARSRSPPHQRLSGGRKMSEDRRRDDAASRIEYGPRDGAPVRERSRSYRRRRYSSPSLGREGGRRAFCEVQNNSDGFHRRGEPSVADNYREPHPGEGRRFHRSGSRDDGGPLMRRGREFGVDKDDEARRGRREFVRTPEGVRGRSRTSGNVVGGNGYNGGGGILTRRPIMNPHQIPNSHHEVGKQPPRGW